jgi:hypothetical protein
MYEHRKQPLLPRSEFLRRLAKNVGYGLALICVSLVGGMLGYHMLGDLSWTDSFLNAAMILSGMGPVDVLHSRAAKIFSGCYAIYSGIALISTAAVIFAPVLHRALHRFHLASDGKE